MNARPSAAARRVQTAALWSASVIGILLQGGCSGMTPREKNTPSCRRGRGGGSGAVGWQCHRHRGWGCHRRRHRQSGRARQEMRAPATFPRTSRREHDAMGGIDVDALAMWGAQTQRALQHFPAVGEPMPLPVIHALALVKRTAARVNASLGMLDAPQADAIVRAAEEILAGDHAPSFPLSLWQSGSGTQTHMNMNEVLANRASELLGGGRGSARKVHPNDQVNQGQSSNDVMPTALHLAVLLASRDELLPALTQLRRTLDGQAREWAGLVKVGRTHLQDAVPITLGRRSRPGRASSNRRSRAGAGCSGRCTRLRSAARPSAPGSTPIHCWPSTWSMPGAEHRSSAGAGSESVRSPVGARRAGGGARRSAHAGRGADEDRQRPALARQRSALRPGRTGAAGERTGQLDHARQGEPQPVRVADHDRRPGHGQRCGHGLGRHAGPTSSSTRRCRSWPAT